MDYTRTPSQPGLATTDSPNFAALGLNMTPTAGRRLDITGAATDTDIQYITNVASSLAGGSTFVGLHQVLSTDTGNSGNSSIDFYPASLGMTVSKTVNTSSGTPIFHCINLQNSTIDYTLSPTGSAVTLWSEAIGCGIVDTIGDTTGLSNTIREWGCFASVTTEPGGGTGAFNKTGGTDTFYLMGCLGAVDWLDDLVTTGTVALDIRGLASDVGLAITAPATATYGTVNVYGAHIAVDVTGSGTGMTLYGAYIASITGTSATLWGFYNASAAAHNLLGLDNVKTYFGTGSDLALYHDSTNSFIDNATGILKIQGVAAGIWIGTAAAQAVGFYGHAAIAQQTGVAVSAAGIHAALVNLGLITA